MQVAARVPLRAIRDIEFPEFGAGYLDLDRLAPRLADAAKLWIGNFLVLYEGESRLPAPRVAATQIAMESDQSFTSFEEALRHFSGPKLPNSANVVSSQVWFDMLLEYPISSDRSAFSIQPGLSHLAARVVVALRFLPPEGSVRAYQFTGDPGRVPLDPSWRQAFLRFLALGFHHILDGPDHLLFLFCLVIPFRRLRSLILIVTAFTAAHSVTLLASALGAAPDASWFPLLMETLIAVSILYMALENIVRPGTTRQRWILAMGFGLIHGFGFSFALRESLQFSGSHLLTSLAAFNLGVEIGQLLVLVWMVPLVELIFRYIVAERLGTIVMSAIGAHTAWHWMVERGARLRQVPWSWPAFPAASLAAAMRGLMWILLFGGAVWLALHLFRKRRAGSPRF